MKPTRKWWMVPVILSAVLGFVPLAFALGSAAYGRSQDVVGGLVILLFVEGAVWAITGIIAVVRKLRRRKVAPA